MLSVTLNGPQGGIEQAATSVLIRDSLGNVLAIAFENSDRAVHIARATDENFAKVCAAFGVDKVVVVRHLNCPEQPLPEGVVKL